MTPLRTDPAVVVWILRRKAEGVVVRIIQQRQQNRQAKGKTKLKTAGVVYLLFAKKYFFLVVDEGKGEREGEGRNW